jgi:peptidoglycan hydrolase CwlO-like protein
MVTLLGEDALPWRTGCRNVHIGGLPSACITCRCCAEGVLSLNRHVDDIKATARHVDDSQANIKATARHVDDSKANIKATARHVDDSKENIEATASHVDDIKANINATAR